MIFYSIGIREDFEEKEFLIGIQFILCNTLVEKNGKQRKTTKTKGKLQPKQQK